MGKGMGMEMEMGDVTASPESSIWPPERLLSQLGNFQAPGVVLHAEAHYAKYDYVLLTGS